MGSFRTGNGRTLAYRELGSGPPLVCHPGGPGFSALYLQDLGGLGHDFSLILLDPRGTGGSDRPTDARAYAIDDYVADVEELRLHLGLDRVDLVGHSHGGFVAMAYAAAYPDGVDRLILTSTLARFSDEQAQAMEAGMEARSGESWYADARAALKDETPLSDEELAANALRQFPLYFAHYNAAAAAYLDILATESVNGDAAGFFNREIVATLDLRPGLPKISAPTLVITGDADFITGPVCADEIAAAIPGARKVILPETGHFIFIEAPDAFRAEVMRFLARA
ncbi:MAG: alpha/beta hydrolase [Chloroflexota bacterium]|nr:alpha/beta hydrolase [Chloroflexota bacterium]